jgi:hypothetical protein
MRHQNECDGDIKCHGHRQESCNQRNRSNPDDANLSGERRLRDEFDGKGAQHCG